MTIFYYFSGALRRFQSDGLNPLDATQGAMYQLYQSLLNLFLVM
jgi:hypothetical protein